MRADPGQGAVSAGLPRSRNVAPAVTIGIGFHADQARADDHQAGRAGYFSRQPQELPTLTESERQKRIIAFDVDTDRPREGWEMLPKKGSGEMWRKVLRDGNTGTVHCWDDGEVTFCIYDKQGETVTEGKTSRRGWAMDACENEGSSTRH
jgi:hypothetical protein